MCHVRLTYLVIAAAAMCFAIHLPTSAQLLNSWEGSLEGWAPQNGATLTTSAAGATQGASALRVVVPNQGFLRWGGRVLSGQALTDLTTAAQNPLLRRIQLDVTYDTSVIPQGPITFINQQIAINTNSGWSQVDFSADQVPGNANTTVTLSAPLSRFGSVQPGSTSAQILIANNTNWGAGMSGVIYYDNLRLSTLVPDLNLDTLVNVSDWSIFIGNHLGTISGTSGQRFLLGDLDSDGDNDFDDFRIFEAGYDEANGTGAFHEMLSNIPEPATAIVVVGGLALWLGGRRRRLQSLLVVAAIGLMSTVVDAQISSTLLHSWESACTGVPPSNCDGWVNVTFNTIPGGMNTSTIGATNGARSFAITQAEDGFSWRNQANYGSGTPNFNAIANAVGIGISNYALEFDVTIDTTQVPQGGVSFVNMAVALNSSGGWIEYGNVGTLAGNLNETQRFSISLDQTVNPPSPGSGVLPPGSTAGFYQINLGMNGDWGLSPATIFVDNMRLVQYTAPPALTLEIDRGNGMASIKNLNTSGMVEFDYYQVSSPLLSLNTGGWNSLDDQNIDALDGPDPGTFAGDSPLEGWDEAGGSSSASVGEAFLLRSSTRGPGQSYSLGSLYDNSVDAQDLVFRYRDRNRNNQFVTGNVAYVGMPPALDGDFDNDGDYDCDDINALSTAVATGGSTATFDLNGDNQLTVADLDVWRIEAGELRFGPGRAYRVADANLDGVVDGSDFNLWNGGKFTTNTNWCSGNFNGDTVIDGSDFNLWNGNKFTSSDGSAAIPEPAGMALAICLAWAGWNGRRCLLG